MQTYRRKPLDIFATPATYRSRTLLPLEPIESIGSSEPAVATELPQDLLAVASSILDTEAARGALPTLTRHSLTPALPVRAGEQVTLPFRLHNDQADPVTFALKSTPLLSATGNRIEPEQLLPSGAFFQLAPDAIQTVHLLLQVPPRTPPALYSGMLTSNELPYLQLPVILDILPSL
jgi:hypothetical protein